MKKYGFVLAVVLALLVLLPDPAMFAQGSEWEDISRGERDFRSVLLSTDEPDIIYAGTGTGVLKSADRGGSWREVLSVPGENKKVNFLSAGIKRGDVVYAATGGGLFYSSNKGERWKRIFKGKDYRESDSTCLAVLPYGIFLGTGGGLFFSQDNGRQWQRNSGHLGRGRISAIAYNLEDPDHIYVVCPDGVFKSGDRGGHWERIYQGKSKDDDPAEEIEEGSQEEDGFFSARYISIDPSNLNYLYLATSGGIYKSVNKGESWEPVSGTGLLSRNIVFILVSDNSRLHAVSKSGAFLFSEERWEELSLRLPADEIISLALDSRGYLYAACDKGLFRSRPEAGGFARQGNTGISFPEDEPDIDQVQKAAITYAEVDIKKIKDWRKRAARKAWLPKVSAGISRDVSDLYHWEGGSTTKVEDDILRKGRDSLGWDIGLSWDLGELIWNQDQTSIDIRSKLMVQLRDDVLDEVTKLYFERLRVKAELDNVSIEDRKKREEKELRVRELTAMLNGLTGGLFPHKAGH